MLDLRQLAVLREVARTGSFAAAARELGISPQAVAQRVAKLEAEAGVRLTVRGRAGVTLTDAGRALARRAGRVLAELDRAEHELRDVAAGSGTSVRVGSLRSGWYHTELADEFLRLAGMTLHPTALDTPDGLRELLAGRLDALLGYDLDLAPARRFPQLRYVEFLAEPVWLACSPRHPAAAGDVVDLRDLRDAAWLAQLPGSALRNYLLAACRAAGFEPRIVYTADSWDLLDPLHQNVGVTLCSPIVVPNDRLTTRPVVQPLRRTLFGAWRLDHPDADSLVELPGIARRLYLRFIEQIPAYAGWLAANPDVLPPLPR